MISGLESKNRFKDRCRFSTLINDIKQHIDSHTRYRRKKPDDAGNRTDFPVPGQVVFVPSIKGDDAKHSTNGRQSDMKDQENCIVNLDVIWPAKRSIPNEERSRGINNKENDCKNTRKHHCLSMLLKFSFLNLSKANRHKYGAQNDEKCADRRQ